MYTYKIYEQSEAKYNQEAAIINDCGIMVAICPLEEAEHIVALKNQWEAVKDEAGVVEMSKKDTFDWKKREEGN